MAVTASSNLGVSGPLWKFVLFNILLLPGLGVSGQSPSTAALQSSEVTIKVTDSSGAVIVNAEVVVQNEAEAVTTRTDGRGVGVVKLHSGTYTLIASSPGFKSTRVADFRVQVPNPSSLDVILRVEPTDSGGWFPPPDILIPIDNAELPNEFLPEVPNPQAPKPTDCLTLKFSRHKVSCLCGAVAVCSGDICLRPSDFDLDDDIAVELRDKSGTVLDTQKAVLETREMQGTTQDGSKTSYKQTERRFCFEGKRDGDYQLAFVLHKNGVPQSAVIFPTNYSHKRSKPCDAVYMVEPLCPK